MTDIDTKRLESFLNELEARREDLEAMVVEDDEEVYAHEIDDAELEREELVNTIVYTIDKLIGEVKELIEKSNPFFFDKSLDAKGLLKQYKDSFTNGRYTQSPSDKIKWEQLFKECEQEILRRLEAI